MELRVIMRSTPTQWLLSSSFSCWLFSPLPRSTSLRNIHWLCKSDVPLFTYRVVHPQPTCSPIFHSPSSLGTQRLSEANSAGPFPPQGAIPTPHGTQPVASTEFFCKNIPPSSSCSGWADSTKEIWQGSCLKCHLALAIGELISRNMSYFPTLNQTLHAIQ